MFLNNTQIILSLRGLSRWTTNVFFHWPRHLAQSMFDTRKMAPDNYFSLLQIFCKSVCFEVQKTCDWLVSHRLPDGGWGENFESCEQKEYVAASTSRAVNTVWALLGLMAVRYCTCTSDDVINRFLHYWALYYKLNNNAVPRLIANGKAVLLCRPRLKGLRQRQLAVIIQDTNNTGPWPLRGKPTCHRRFRSERASSVKVCFVVILN